MNGSMSRIPTPLRRPPQGWSTLLILLAMLALVGISIGEARLLTVGGSDVGGSIVVLMMAAGIIGFLLARSSIGVVRAHLIGAAIGAAIILLAAGAAVQERSVVVPASWDDLRMTIAMLSARVQADLRGADAAVGEVPAVVVSYLLLGAICWTTAQFSVFGTFRYDRGGPAILAIGMVLFLNLTLSSWRSDAELLPVMPQLVLFAALAMLLLMRLQLQHQRAGWIRRHIADTGEVSRLFLRSGVLFVVLAIVGASTLTLAASTGPHELSTDDLEEVFGDLGEDVSGLLSWLNVPGVSDRPQSLDDDFDVPPSWTPGRGTAFVAQLDDDLAGNYWWMSAHDQFDGWTWRTADARTERTDGGIEATAGDGDGPLLPLQATISVDAMPFARTVVGLAETYQVSEPVRLTLIDANDGIGMIEFQDRSSEVVEYDVSALVRRYGKRPDAITARQLRSAGDRYPRWVDEYLQGAGEAASSGPLTQQLAERIERRSDNAYDRAIAVQDTLRDMDYTVDMGATCDGLNVPECVLTFERGFCQYYASTMAMVLREMGIPSRMVRGYLPGEEQPDGSWLVENQAFHAWVEAYFPGYGWIRFDPTPGGDLVQFGQEGTQLEPGGPEPTEPPDRDRDNLGPDESFPAEPTPDPDESFDPSPCADCPGDDGDGALVALIVGGGIAGLLLITIGLLWFMRLRRLPMGDEGIAYRGLVRLATRLGHGPHPAQTEYEYASSLSQTLPSVRDDLYLVTASRVESSYGQRRLDDEVRPALRRAYRRIRTALLRLSFRRR